MAQQDRRQPQISARTHCGLDSMSNVACIPQDTAKYLDMTTKKPGRPMNFGSLSHDGIVSIANVAKFQDNRYLPTFAITATGTMPILPTFWLTQMGYSLTILPYEKGFQIIDPERESIVYEGIQSADKFHYVLWDFLIHLGPTKKSRAAVPRDDVYSSVNFMQYTGEVCMHLDDIEHFIGIDLKCNATRRERNHIPTQTIQDIREAHSRYGHMNRGRWLRP